MLQRRLVFEWWAIFAFASIIAGVAAHSGFTKRFDNLLLDQAMPLASPPPSDAILIVEIDERSLADIGSWPWKRSVHAALIEKIAAAGPKVIGYDVLFIEAGDADDDQKLADAVAASKRVILPFQYQIPGSNGRAVDQFLPFAPLPAVAAGLGHVGLKFDPDGLVRRIDLKGQQKDFPYPHLMEVMRSIGTVLPAPAATAASPGGTVLLPLNPRSSYRTVPASSVFRDQVPPDFFRDRYVLVGASAQGMADIFPVSAAAGSIMPGVEIQANLLNGLLASQFVIEAGFEIVFAAALVAITSLMLAFWRLRPRANLILAIIVLVTLVAGAALLVIVGRYWIAPGPALIAIMMLYPLWGWRRLAALNDFISVETSRLTGDDDSSAKVMQSGGLDAVARQAMQLRSVIGEMSDRQHFMNRVIGAAPDAICVIDDRSRIILANNAAKLLFGEAVIGQSFPELIAVEGGQLPADESEWTAPSGNVLLITRSFMAINGGSAGGLIYCLSDITAIREAERERREMLEFLSHDMRSPQAAIVSLVDTHKPDGGAPSDLLPRIRNHAVQTLKLTDDFVQLARLASVELRMEEMNLADLLREAIDQNYALAQFNSITVEYQPDNDFHYIMVDGAAIIRALSNLISNAIRFSPPGASVHCKIWSGNDVDQPRTYCSISDNGPGMPPERRANPFDRFGHRDENQAIGVGLGLAFVKSAIDRNHGQIACTSSPTQGTRFTLDFSALA